MGERSLVRFTLLVQASCGALLGLVGVQLAGAADVLGVVSFVAVGLMVLVAVAVSTVHLGAPRHASWAVANWRRSWLSREILGLGLLGTLVAAGALVALLSDPARSAAARSAVAALAALAGVLVVGTMVRLYAVRTIPEWDARTTAARFGGSALRLGAVVAGFLVALAPGAHETNLLAGGWLALLLTLGLGLEVVVQRLPRTVDTGRAGALLVRGVEPPADRATAGWVVAGAVGSAIGIAILGAGLPVAAAAVLTAGLAVLARGEVVLRDRFYRLAPRRGRDTAHPRRTGAR
jgi:DMSO reductase anchor subunit